jgi:RND family efflux transporter MFP subunit
MRPCFVILLHLLLLSGCASQPARKFTTTPAAPIIVETVALRESDLPFTYEGTGTVRARTSTAISARIMGYAREVRTQVGDQVHENQILVVLDSSEMEANVSRARAALEEVKSAIPEAESGIAAASARAELAQITYARVQDLFGKRSVTNQELDEALAQLKAATAAHEMARAKRVQLDAKLTQVEQEMRSATIQRSYAQIRAPFTGIILSRSIEPGTLTVPGAPLLTIERQDSYRLETSVEESRLPLAKVGRSVSVTIDGLGRSCSGKVSEIAPAVDPVARRGTVKIDLPPLSGLRSGLFGRAHFEAGVHSELIVPDASVVTRGQSLQFVYVAENNVAHARLVTLGVSANQNRQVLSGLNAGDRVVVPIPVGLTDGSRIEVRR